jgi:hypothetical protein
MLSDYGLSDSDIEQIRSALSHNEVLKDRFDSYHIIGLYIVLVASMWPWFSVASIFLGVVAMVVYACSIGGLVVYPLGKKYFKERELKIPGASNLKEYEHQLAQYKVFKERERIKEEERRAKEEKERERKSWEYWTELSPFEFEDEMAELFRESGYDAKVTPATGDGGVDIILSKGGKEILVQCKRHSSKVGPAPIRELYGVMSSRGVTEGFMVCPAGFTSGAYDFAKKHNILLIGLKRIMELATANNST